VCSSDLGGPTPGQNSPLWPGMLKRMMNMSERQIIKQSKAAMTAACRKHYRAHIRRNVHIYSVAPHEGRVELLQKRLPLISEDILSDHSYAGLKEIYGFLIVRMKVLKIRNQQNHWTYDINRHLGVIAMAVAVRQQLITQSYKAARAA